MELASQDFHLFRLCLGIITDRLYLTDLTDLTDLAAECKYGARIHQANKRQRFYRTSPYEVMMQGDLVRRSSSTWNGKTLICSSIGRPSLEDVTVNLAGGPIDDGPSVSGLFFFWTSLPFLLIRTQSDSVLCRAYLIDIRRQRRKGGGMRDRFDAPSRLCDGPWVGGWIQCHRK